MVRLNWGNFLSVVLPGAVATLALQYYVDAIAGLLSKPNELSLSGGTILLFVAGISGGIIEGIRRLLIDELILNRLKAFGNQLPTAEESFFFYLDRDSLPVFTAGIDESYRYFTFYANLGLAILFWAVTRIAFRGTCNLADAGLIILTLGLFGSAYVQHKYFRHFLEAFRARQKQRVQRESQKSAEELAGAGKQD